LERHGNGGKGEDEGDGEGDEARKRTVTTLMTMTYFVGTRHNHCRREAWRRHGKEGDQ